MKGRQIPRLPGMQDVDGSSEKRTKLIEDALSEYFEREGFLIIDTPLLEQTELFIRKSGGALTSRLYSFTDPGGNKVSIRPEFTSSVIRAFIQLGKPTVLPLRQHYCGPVLRFDDSNSEYRQFTQVGAEIIGDGQTEADADIVQLAWESLSRIGMKGHCIRIGNLSVLKTILDTYGLSEAAKLFIMNRAHGLKMNETDVEELLQRAGDVGLLSAKDNSGPKDNLHNDRKDQKVQEFAHNVLSKSISGPTGRRTTKEIIERLVRKSRQADDPEVFKNAASVISVLTKLEGAPASVIKKATGILKDSNINANVLGYFQDLIDLVDRRKVPQDSITVDLGLARGIAYYTGAIFEIMAPESDRMVSVGGGGRYDGLVKDLGGPKDIPALGFAYNIDHICSVLPLGSPKRVTHL